uniref:receptor protein-tyrosine kinase n=1 Tax=Cacopsylla melanoneura TaxID=428564 RepID=A0A8D8YM00_9HEMI
MILGMETIIIFWLVCTLRINSAFSSTPQTDNQVESNQPSPNQSTNHGVQLTEDSTLTKTETHPYYQSTISWDETRAKSLWLDLSETASRQDNESYVRHYSTQLDFNRNEMVNDLLFDFPFYNHPIRHLTIGRGFLGVGDKLSPSGYARKTATYIAPLSASFDFKRSNQTLLHILCNKTQITVTWENIPLEQRVLRSESEYLFTFQTSLYRSGQIVFVYKSIPANVTTRHIHQLGLSRYIKEYDFRGVVNLTSTKLENWTCIVLSPTCVTSDGTDLCSERSNKIPVSSEYSDLLIKNDTYFYYKTSMSRDETRGRSLWFEPNTTEPPHEVFHRFHYYYYGDDRFPTILRRELVKAHEYFMVIEIPFEFPFFSQPVHQLTITKNGFLGVGDKVEELKRYMYELASDFISPLTARFKPELYNDSCVQIWSNETQVTVTWENVWIPNDEFVDRDEYPGQNNNIGGFTFQTSLYKSGRIAFVYKSIPEDAIDLFQASHPPVGITDAEQYYYPLLGNYDPITFTSDVISNWTSILLSPLPTCSDYKDCTSCLSQAVKLNCSWCEVASLCSTGVDGNHRVWLQMACYRLAVKEVCPSTMLIHTSSSQASISSTLQPPIMVTSQPPTAVSIVPISEPLFSALWIGCLCTVLVLVVVCLQVQRRKRLKTRLAREKEKTAMLTQWIKRITIETQASTQDDGLMMPLVRIEKHKTEIRTDRSDMPLPEYELPLDKSWEFPRHCLTLGQTLGEGFFGKVVRAEAKDILKPDTVTTVAVKMLKQVHTVDDLTDLLSEMTILKTIGKHNNIISLLGVCLQNGPVYVIMEYAPHNNLRNFLRIQNPLLSEHLKEPVSPGTHRIDLTEKDFLSFAHQVASGMQYLHAQKCIHRDLAARNVLVGENEENFVMKIADFGLARDVHVDDLYERTSHNKLPIKWLAPESLADNLYSYKADVWSFGILLWEIFTFGEMPYPTLSNMETEQFVKAGQRMDKPEKCSEEVYEVMTQCWHHEASDRPEFSELMCKLEQMKIGPIEPNVSSVAAPLSPVPDNKHDDTHYVRIIKQSLLDKTNDGEEYDARYDKLKTMFI